MVLWKISTIWVDICMGRCRSWEHPLDCFWWIHFHIKETVDQTVGLVIFQGMVDPVSVKCKVLVTVWENCPGCFLLRKVIGNIVLKNKVGLCLFPCTSWGLRFSLFRCLDLVVSFSPFTVTKLLWHILEDNLNANEVLKSFLIVTLMVYWDKEPSYKGSRSNIPPCAADGEQDIAEVFSTKGRRRLPLIGELISGELASIRGQLRLITKSLG